MSGSRHSSSDPTRAHLDPAARAARLADLQAKRATRTNCDALELYERCSGAVRLGRDPAGEALRARLGREDGVAVRLRCSADGRRCFASASGHGESSVDWAIQRALQGSGSASPVPEPDGCPPLEAATDHDPHGPPPALEELEAWLAEAWERLVGACEMRGLVRPRSAWVEVATTVESWAAEGGVRASRARRRAWAVARLERADPAAPMPRPLVAATRRWEDLTPKCWSGLLERRWLTPGPPWRAQGRRQTIWVAPEAAAGLVFALARALHTGGPPAPFEVGAGWRLAEDPTRAGALHGALFDDALWVTAPRELADGRRAVGTIDGAGQLRRPSFRDPPEPRPFHLVLGSDVPAGGPEEGLVSTQLGVHPLSSERWVLEIDGVQVSAGEIAQPVHQLFAAASPLELVRRCVGSWDDPADFHQGVTTPGLVLDSLELLASP